MLTKNERKELKLQAKEYKKQAQAHKKQFKMQKAEQKRQKSQQSDKKNEAVHNNKSSVKNILSVFPIRDYQEGYFLTDDNRIIDLFQVRGRSYYDASDEEIEILVLNFEKMLRKYSADMKFIGMNYPTNTKLQQAFLSYKLKQPELEKYEDILNEKLSTLQALEQSTTDREAFVMVFANNKNHYDSLCNILSKSGSFRIEPISQEKKENIIFQLNNMNKCVKI